MQNRLPVFVQSVIFREVIRNCPRIVNYPGITCETGGSIRNHAVIRAVPRKVPGLHSGQPVSVRV